MIVIIGTLDTKGDKVAYLKQLIEGKGEKTLVIDSGVLGSPSFQADISRERVAEAAGGSLKEIASLGFEAKAMAVMAKGTSNIVEELYSSGKVDGIIGLGGTMGTSLSLAAIKVLPVGMPKVMVTTVQFGLLRYPQATLDLIIVPAVSDIWGLNSLSMRMLQNAAGAIVGAVQLYKQSGELPHTSFVAISTLGTSTLKYVIWLKPLLEEKGFDVAVFHAAGQGHALEQLVRRGMIKGVLELCLSELTSLLCGSPFIVPREYEAAGEKGIPQVIAPGGIDFFTWGSLDTLPEKYKNRKKYQHNEITWLIESSLEEVAETAHMIDKKLNKGRGPEVEDIQKIGN